MVNAASAAAIEEPPVLRLTDLRVGDYGRLHTADLAVQDREVLHALGLVKHSRFRLCKAGNPWIVQVRGTRVGLSDAVACRLLVVPERQPEGAT